jgi:hypothetical protein
VLLMDIAPVANELPGLVELALKFAPDPTATPTATSTDARAPSARRGWRFA